MCRHPSYSQTLGFSRLEVALADIRLGTRTQCRPKSFAVVLQTVFGKAQASKKRKRHDPLLGEEGPDDFAEKLGRWRGETFTAMSDPRLWATLRLSHRARTPWHHFFRAVEKYSAQALGREMKNVSFCALLVWGKGDEIAHEFELLLNRNCWRDILEPQGHDMINTSHNQRASSNIPKTIHSTQ